MEDKPKFPRDAVLRYARAKEGMSMQTRRATLVSSLLLVVGLGLLFLCTEALADGECRRKIKVPLTDFGTGIAGKATLCIDDKGPDTGVSGSIEARHLQPGNAYSIWFVYWDDPSKCEVPGMCGSHADFGGDKPLDVFGRFDSAVAPADGEEDFEGRVRGLRLTSGSLVWLLMFGHGPADTSDHSHLTRQLLTPEDPNAGAPNLGNFVDGPEACPQPSLSFRSPEAVAHSTWAMVRRTDTPRPGCSPRRQHCYRRGWTSPTRRGIGGSPGVTRGGNSGREN